MYSWFAVAVSNHEIGISSTDVFSQNVWTLIYNKWNTTLHSRSKFPLVNPVWGVSVVFLWGVPKVPGEMPPV